MFCRFLDPAFFLQCAAQVEVSFKVVGSECQGPGEMLHGLIYLPDQDQQISQVVVGLR